MQLRRQWEGRRSRRDERFDLVLRHALFLQHDQNIANDTGAATRADINNALGAAFSLSSGASAPSTTVAYMLWADTTAGLLKIRNAANSGWVTIGTLASTNLALMPLTGGTLTGASGVSSNPASPAALWSLNYTLARANGNKYGILFSDSAADQNAGIVVEQQSGANNNAFLDFFVNGGTGGTAVNSGSRVMRLFGGSGVAIGDTSMSSVSRLNLYDSAGTSTTQKANTLQRVASNGNGADVNVALSDNVANNTWIGQAQTEAYIINNSNGVKLTNGATSWASNSDERQKDIIEAITGAVAKVGALRAVIGKYKGEEEGVRRSFLIAQDVQVALPEAVDVGADGFLVLRYTEVLPLLVAAITELSSRLAAVEAP